METNPDTNSAIPPETQDFVKHERRKHRLRKAALIALAAWVVLVLLFCAGNYFVNYPDLLRWNLNYVFLWGIFISLLAATVLWMLSFERIWLRVAGIVLTSVLWLFVAWVVFVFGSVFNQRLWHNSDYVVRFIPGFFIDPGQVVLYQKQGLVEKHKATLTSEWGTPQHVSIALHPEQGTLTLRYKYRPDWAGSDTGWTTFECVYDTATALSCGINFEASNSAE